MSHASAGRGPAGSPVADGPGAGAEAPFADELWTCPACGHRLVTKGMWHSCSRYDLEHHFAGVDPAVRRSFDAFLAAVERCGPVVVIPQKSRIAIQARVRFAGCMVRKRWLLAHLWLTREAEHPRLRRVDTFGPRAIVHTFRLQRPEDLDEALERLVREAYRVGLREHLRPPPG